MASDRVKATAVSAFSNAWGGTWEDCIAAVVSALDAYDREHPDEVPWLDFVGFASPIPEERTPLYRIRQETDQ